MLYYLHHTEQEQRVKSEEIKRLVAKGENAAVEFKQARGDVPASFWPSCSSFANTDGIERTLK